jgi:hypothetical protein
MKVESACISEGPLESAVVVAANRKPAVGSQVLAQLGSPQHADKPTFLRNGRWNRQWLLLRTEKPAVGSQINAAGVRLNTGKPTFLRAAAGIGEWFVAADKKPAVGFSN